MPRAVVEVADLLLVLHHVGRLPSLLVLHCNVVLDSLKILPVLNTRKKLADDVKRYEEIF